MPDIEPLYMSEKSRNGRSKDDEIRQTGLRKMPHTACCISRQNSVGRVILNANHRNWRGNTISKQNISCPPFWQCMYMNKCYRNLALDNGTRFTAEGTHLTLTIHTHLSWLFLYKILENIKFIICEKDNFI